MTRLLGVDITWTRRPNGAQRRGYSETEQTTLRFVSTIYDSQLTSYLINLAT